MKKTIKLNYRSIFKYEDHQETVKYDGLGYLENGFEQDVISYQDEKMIKLILKKNEIDLYNGVSALKLIKNKDILNHYQTDYGVIELKTRLISYEKGKTIKIKYELYDGVHLISQVYILLSYIVLEN